MHVAIAPQSCYGPQTLSQDIFSHPSGIYHEGWLETSHELLAGASFTNMDFNLSMDKKS